MLCAYLFMDGVWAMFLARIPFALGGGALARAPLVPDITVHSVLASRPSLQVLAHLLLLNLGVGFEQLQAIFCLWLFDFSGFVEESFGYSKSRFGCPPAGCALAMRLAGALSTLPDLGFLSAPAARPCLPSAVRGDAF